MDRLPRINKAINKAKLNNAELYEADLSGAYLRDAIVTEGHRRTASRL
jgi:uncharacterized protein YjbI with pentapeptide repeats